MLISSLSFSIVKINHLLVPQNIQIWLKSSRGAIDVFLCPDDLPGEESTSSGSGDSEESTASADGHDEVS